MLQACRAGLILVCFLAFTLPLMPVQWLLLTLPYPGARAMARRLPVWYHRQVCRLLGVRIHLEGEMVTGQPALIVANHASWLDIPVISTLGPVSFIAKSDVAGWPLVGALARLQRSVFVDRDDKRSVGFTVSEVEARLQGGDIVLLFAEGTSSDGNQVLPFKSALFSATGVDRASKSAAINGAGHHDAAVNGADIRGISLGGRTGMPATAHPLTPVQVQPLTIAYTRLHGISLGRHFRPHVAWYGDMEMVDHAWALLKAGPLDVRVRIGPPVPLHTFKDRKMLARFAEQQIRAANADLLGYGENPSPN